MSSVTQVAFQIDGDRLAALDGLVADHVFRSRAEVLRTAVDEFLRRRREERIDAELEAGYRAAPAGSDEATLADVSVDGLEATDLDW
jgi:Arc/MetJ-type ribon-helix-helix transcriptional regulator